VLVKVVKIVSEPHGSLWFSYLHTPTIEHDCADAKERNARRTVMTTTTFMIATSQQKVGRMRALGVFMRAAKFLLTRTSCEISDFYGLAIRVARFAGNIQHRQQEREKQTNKKKNKKNKESDSD
jgi:hypothetical protein